MIESLSDFESRLLRETEKIYRLGVSDGKCGTPNDRRMLDSVSRILDETEDIIKEYLEYKYGGYNESN